MFFQSVFSTMNRWHIHFLSFFKGKRVGQDSFGNVYYKGKPRGQNRRERRWVKYKADAEASYVPPVWHGWLHHQTDEIPQSNGYVHSWQKEPKPNLTGTPLAYKPPGYPDKEGVRKKATGDYEVWKP